MLRKIFFFFLFIISITTISGFIYYNFYLKQNINNNQTNSWQKIENDTFKEITITPEEKIEQFKRRLNFKSIIRKWDFYNIKNMKETALEEYFVAYRRLKSDHVLEKKIADTYFEMKNYSKAYSYYKKIPPSELDDKYKEKIVKTLLYTWEKNMRDEFGRINLDKNLKDYYDKVLVCYTWIANCIKEIKSYSWTSEKINIIKKDISDYESIWHTDPNSKYAILAWNFMKNKDFLATAVISQETLQKRPNYSSVLKLAWFSYYELWDYKNSNNFLQKYYEIDPKDIKVTYLLWIVNFYLEDYISSNLYFNAAVLNWYRPKNELQKRLAYNYYILWDKKNILKVFRYILDEEDVTIDDYTVAIFTAIEEREYSKASLRSDKWLKKFPNSDMMYAFRWWIYRIKNEQLKSLNDLNLSLNINPRNAVALFNLWIINFERWYYKEAINNFESTIEVDSNWTFGEQSKIKLTEVKQKQTESEITSQSWTENN